MWTSNAPDEHPLNVLLEIWIDSISKDCQFPQLLVSPDIPRLDIAAAAILIGRDIADAFVNYRVHLHGWETLGRGQLGQDQRQQKYDGQSNQKSITCNSDHRDIRSQVLVSGERVCYGRALINDPWNGITM